MTSFNIPFWDWKLLSLKILWKTFIVPPCVFIFSSFILVIVLLLVFSDSFLKLLVKFLPEISVFLGFDFFFLLDNFHHLLSYSLLSSISWFLSVFIFVLNNFFDFITQSSGSLTMSFGVPRWILMLSLKMLINVQNYVMETGWFLLPL